MAGHRDFAGAGMRPAGPDDCGYVPASSFVLRR